MKQSHEPGKFALPLIAEADMKACAEEAKCCHCGACCTMFSIPDVPRVGREGPGSVRTFFGYVFKQRKDFGERCAHLLETPDGRSLCALHGKKHKPATCRQWRGNLVVFEAVADDEPVHGFDMLRHNTLLALREPPNDAAIEELRRLLRTGVLRALVPVPPLTDIGTILMFVQSWIIKYGIMDHELFECAGLPEALSRSTQSQLDEVVALLHPRHVTHQAFKRRYIDPLLRSA